MSRCAVSVYEHAAAVLDKVAGGTGVRTTLYGHSMPDALRPAVLALVSETLKHEAQLTAALEAEATVLATCAKERSMVLVVTYELAVRGGTIKGGAKSPVVRAVFARKAELTALVQEAQPAGDGAAAPAPAPARLPRYVRVNTLKLSVDDALVHLEREDGLRRLEPKADPSGPLWRKGAVREDPLLPTLLVLPPGTSLHGHPLVEAGALILQDRASCLPARALAPPAGAKVLDACAAPGNKTTQLAALVGAAGAVCAFERNEQRFGTLRRQVARAGAAHVRCCHADFLLAAPAEYRGYTHALCDPSCSGSGGGGGHHPQRRERPDEYAARLRSLAASQVAVVGQAMAMPDMEVVVYSTCSVHREENEDVVAELLRRHARRGWRLGRALPHWPTRGLAEAAVGPMCARASAGDETHGFFVARFERGAGNATVAAEEAASEATVAGGVDEAAAVRKEQQQKKAKAPPSAPPHTRAEPHQKKRKRAAPAAPAPRAPLSAEEAAAERRREKRRRKDEARKARKKQKQAPTPSPSKQA